MPEDRDDLSLLGNPAAATPHRPLPGHADAAAAKPQTSGLAIASLVLGILGFLSACFVVGAPLALVAVLLGAIALTRIGKPGQPRDGRGMAIAGVALGVLGSLIGLVALLGVVSAVMSGVNGLNGLAAPFATAMNGGTLAGAVSQAEKATGDRVLDPGELLAGGWLDDPAVFLLPDGPAAELPVGFDNLDADAQERFLRENAGLLLVPGGDPPAETDLVVVPAPGVGSEMFGESIDLFVVRANGQSDFLTADDLAAALEQQTGSTWEELEATFRNEAP